MVSLKMKYTHSQITIPMVGALPIELAIIELLHLLFLILHRKYIKTSMLNCNLKVKIRTIGVNTGGDQAWFCVRIKCSDLEDMEPNLENLLPGFAKSTLTIIQTMQKIFPGEFIWMERSDPNGSRTLVWHLLNEANHFQMRIEKKEGKRDLESPLHETSICMKIVQSKEHMVGECEKVCNFMHRLKLFAPLCNIQFYLNVWGVVSSSKFDWNSYKVCVGQRRMAADIQHFLPKDQETYGVNRIYPKLGCPYILACPKGQNAEDNVKLSTAAAILPQPLGSELGTRELNTKCRQLKVLFYGPGSVPLILPTQQQSALCPSTILKLDEFGLCLDGKLEEGSNLDTVHVDWSYKLKPVGEDWQDNLLDWEDNTETQLDPTYTILLIIFIERAKPLQEWHVEDDLLLIDTLRQKFVQLLCRHRTKIRKAVSQALNKLLQNLSKEDQKQDLVQKTISTVSGSLSEMIARSQNVQFQERCMKELDVNYISEVNSSIRSNLWDIASERYGVMQLAVNKRRSNNIAKKKRESSEKLDPNQAKRPPDGFDDLAGAVDIAPTLEKIDSSPALEIDLEAPLSPFSGLRQFNDNLSDNAGEENITEFLHSLEDPNLPKQLHPEPLTSWDLLSNEELLQSINVPFSMANEFTGSTFQPDELDTSQSAHEQDQIDAPKINIAQAPSAYHVKDHLLSQVSTKDWLKDFSDWD